MINLTNIEFYKNKNDNWREEVINGRKKYIPLDWYSNKLNKYIEKLSNGITVKENSNKKGNMITRIETLSENNINLNKVGYTEDSLPLKHKINHGDLLISNINSPKFVGRTVCFNLNIDLYHSINLLRLQSKDIDKNFMFYLMTNNIMKNAYKIYMKMAVNQASIGVKDILNIINISPTNIEEQEKIAKILETQENLILSKKELLEKYKKQRKYFQQELLSGRIRMKLNNKSMAEAFELGLIKQTFLNDANEVVEYGSDTITNVNIGIIDKDGFENWLSIDFENKIEFYKNIDFKEEKINGRIISIPKDFYIKSIKDIAKINFGQRITKKNNIGASSYPVVGSGNESFKTNTYNRENEITIGRFALSKKCINKHKMKFFLNDSGMTLSSYNDNQILLNYLLFFNEFLIYNCARGAAQKNMDMKEFSNLKFYLPNSLEEQTLIAEQLTKIDNLIESLEEEIKLEDKKFTYLKQELLSGRIRVK